MLSPGYVVSGSNGEAPVLSPDERVELVKRVRRSVASGKVVVGGATSECKYILAF